MADTQKIFKEFDFAGYIALRENLKKQAVLMLKEWGLRYGYNTISVENMPQHIIGLNDNGNYENLVQTTGAMAEFSLKSYRMIPARTAVCLYAVSNHGTDNMIMGLEITQGSIPTFSFYMRQSIDYIGEALFEKDGCIGVLPASGTGQSISVTIYSDKPVVNDLFIMGMVGYYDE